MVRVAVSVLLSGGLLSPPWLAVAAWTDTDSDGNNDRWTDPISQVATDLVDLNASGTDVDYDGATN